MDINYELYKVFYQVASTMSFSEASRQLYISQSAVSQSIKSLEKKLGHSLFNRSTKRISLTPEGEMLYRHITPAIHMIQSAEEQIMEKHSLNGQLRISASDTICRYFLVPYLNRFHTEYPNVHIRIVNHPSADCMELLKQGQVDLVFVNTPLSQLEQCAYTREVLEFQDTFVANPKYFNTLTSALSMNQLQQLPLITLQKNTTTSHFLHDFFKNRGYLFNPEIELSSNDLVLDLTSIGLGVGFLPDYMIKKELQDLKVLNTEFDLPKRKLVLASNQINMENSIIQEFLNYF